MTSPTTQGPEVATRQEDEPKNESLTAKVTESVKRDAALVSGFDNITVSQLLYESSINQIVARAAEIRSLSRQIEGAPV